MNYTCGYCVEVKVVYCITPLFFAHLLIDALPQGCELVYRWNFKFGFSCKHLMVPLCITLKIDDEDDDEDDDDDDDDDWRAQ